MSPPTVDVPPVQPAGRAAPGGADRQQTGGSGLPFTAGQRVFARVVQMIGANQALLDVAGYRLLASTPMSLAAGQVLAVEIRSLAPVVELGLEAPPVQFSEHAYALAALRQAREALPDAPGTPGREAILRLLDALARSGWGAIEAGGEPRAQLARLLLAIPLARDGAAIVDTLRAHVAQVLTSLEARFARGGTEPDAVPRGVRVQDDLRFLLGLVARDTNGSPELEALRIRLLQDATARQLDTAYHWVKDGELRLDLPIMFGTHHAELRLRIQPDGGERPAKRRGRGVALDLSVRHPELGPVHVAVRWASRSLQVRVAVSTAFARDVLAAHVTAFERGLRSAGYSHVDVRLDVDPAATQRPRELPEEPPPGGSILSALV
ncbi:MAG TPA: flagellar hook-length control protein FliK [Vicinamibacterales bacterium]